MTVDAIVSSTKSRYEVKSPRAASWDEALWAITGATGRQDRLSRLASRLVSFADLAPGWDSYDAERPSSEALRDAYDALLGTWQTLMPIAVVPSVEGGVTLVYADDDRGYAEVEFGNDGEVVAAFRSPAGEVDAWDVDKDLGMRFVLEQFRRRLGHGA